MFYLGRPLRGWSHANPLATSLIRFANRRWNYNAWCTIQRGIGREAMVHAASLTHINQAMESSAALTIRQSSVSLSVCLSVCLSLSLYSMTDVSVPFSFHNVHPIRASLSDLCPTRHPFAYRHWHAAACIPLSSIACRRLGISMLISCDVWLNGGYYGPWADHNVVSQRETRRESSDFLPKLSTFNWLVRAIFNDCNEHVAYIATAIREIS